MLISYNWLKKYVNIPDSVSAEEVAAKLKASTVEVEKVDYQGKNLENVVVGKVVACEKHPNADKLKVCIVDDGERVSPSGGSPAGRQIVCGGSNVSEGMLVALGKLGAKVKWHGEGDLVELKQTAIRGVDSFGMICASTEIGLGEMFPESGEKSPSGGSPAGREILDLSVIASGAKQSPGHKEIAASVASGDLPRNDKLVGRPLAEVLGLDDAVLEIDNKSLSNRPDLWGHYGIAREVAVLFGKKLKEYRVKKIKAGKEIKLRVAVEDAKLCPRYMAVAMSGVEVKPSPEWLQKALVAVGLRSINNIVDITNYVMMDLGQPMHSFDAERLRNPKSQIPNPKVIVRRANDGEKFITLDGKDHILSSEMLVIASEEKILAIAGVMGGIHSGINNETKTIIFESANFDASSIRKTSTKLGLRTDSSARFEKSLDPNLAEIALQRAVELVLEVCPKARVASNVVDQKKFHLAQGPLEISMEFLEKKIGTKLQKKEVVRILNDLGFVVTGKGDEFKVKIPSWRATKDISIPEDLVEEILRVYGYDKVKSSMPFFPINPPEENKLRELERGLKNILVNSLSYTEVYNYSFVSPQSINKLGDDPAKYLELDNPLSQERPFLRRHLLNNLLENVKKNIDDYPELRMFEVGKKFLQEKPGARATANSSELLPRQDAWLVAVFASKKNKDAFWQARRAAETAFAELNKELKLTPPKKLLPWMHPSRSGEMVLGDRYAGSVFELHPTVIENFGLKCAVAVMALNLDEIANLPETEKKYKTLSEFPAMERDLAILVKKSVAHEDVLSALSGISPLLQSVELFDVYEGEVGNSPLVPILENRGSSTAVGRRPGWGGLDGRKSMAYHFVYQSPERTLVTEEVDKAHDAVIKILKDKFGAEVR